MTTIKIQAGQTEAILDCAQKSARDMEPVLRAAGTTLLSITLGNFNSVGADLRPIPWKPKKDGSPTTLKRSGLLSGSFKLTVNSKQAELTNPTIYAAIHQFGGKTKPHKIFARNKKALSFNSARFGKIVVKSVNHPGSNIPARPFIPITPDGDLTPAAETLITSAAQRAFQKQMGL